MNYTKIVFIQQANMKIVDKLLDNLPDWENILLKRHLKFVRSYLSNNKDLRIVGEEFQFTHSEMLSIFWRIQKKLQIENSRRVVSGEVSKQISIVKNIKVIK